MIPNLTGSISPLMNVVPTPGTMTIIPIDFVGPIPKPTGPPYIVMFNPERLDESTRFVYDDSSASGSSQAELKFNFVDNSEVQFEFLIDGTGASGDKREVLAEIELFRFTTGFNGNKHQPNFLTLIWGTFIFQGYLSSMAVKYTLFRPNGTPLRASLNCTFIASTTNVLRLLANALFSPDLTQEVLVKSGDRLDNLCQQLYESPRHYIDVARANNLTSFRKLPEGAKMYFPPIAK